MPVNRSVAAVVALVLLGSVSLAVAQTKLHSVGLNLDVTWAGKRGIQIPIRPGSNETLKGVCPPVIEINAKLDPSDPIPVEARYTFSDGRTLDRKQTIFMGGLYTESWELPIKNDGQTYQGSVTLHINSPATDQNDVTVPFSVACSSAAAATSACDQSGNSCHAGVQLGTPVMTESSAEAAPTTNWTGGTLLPGTYVLTAAKQYTFKDSAAKITADPNAAQITAVLKKNGADDTAELVVTENGCQQRAILAVGHNPKSVPGAFVPAYAPVFSGSHAVTLTTTCPPDPQGASAGFPAAYSVTPTGFRVMLMMGTVLTFTRKP